MNLRETRANYYHIPPKVLDHKSNSRSKLQSDVEVFKAAGGKIDVIPMGYSSYLSNLNAVNKARYGRAQK